MIIQRRSFLMGLVAAPAVIAIDRLMPVKLWVPPAPRLQTVYFMIGKGVIMLNPQGNWVHAGSIDDYPHMLKEA